MHTCMCTYMHKQKDSILSAKSCYSKYGEHGDGGCDVCERVGEEEGVACSVVDRRWGRGSKTVG